MVRVKERVMVEIVLGCIPFISTVLIQPFIKMC